MLLKPKVPWPEAKRAFLFRTGFAPSGSEKNTASATKSGWENLQKADWFG
jgi:hypothetical protein